MQCGMNTVKSDPGLLVTHMYIYMYILYDIYGVYAQNLKKKFCFRNTKDYNKCPVDSKSLNMMPW